MATQGNRFSKIIGAFKIFRSFVQIWGADLNDEKESPTATVTVRKGTLLESRAMEYPKFYGSVLHNVRLPFKPLHLFKIECTDSLDRETLVVLTERTPLNADAMVGMLVTVTSRQNLKDLGYTEHTVNLD